MTEMENCAVGQFEFQACGVKQEPIDQEEGDNPVNADPLTTPFIKEETMEMEETILPTTEVNHEIMSLIARIQRRKALARERQRRRRARLKEKQLVKEFGEPSICEKKKFEEHLISNTSTTTDLGDSLNTAVEKSPSKREVEFEEHMMPKLSPHLVKEESIETKSEKDTSDIEVKEHLVPKTLPRLDTEDSVETKQEKANEEGYILPMRPKAGIDPDEEPNFMTHLSNDGSKSSLSFEDLNDYDDVPVNSLEPITIVDVPKKGRRSYKCTYCPKVFVKKIHLGYHLPTHTGLKPFACDLCEKSYPRKENLLRHRALHLSDTPFICSVCEKGFRYKNKMDDHRKANHPDDCFRCEVCDRLFSDEKARDKHMGAHNLNRTYICDVCSKEYKNKSALYSHRSSHVHKPQQHPCDMCSETFYYRQTMLRHRQRVHMSTPSVYPRIRRPRNPYKPFSCEICHKKLRTKFNLEYHRKTHFKKKPHTCKVCNITLPSRDDFVQHKQEIHPNERVFTCETCSMGFWHRELLVKHVAKHLVPPQ